MTRLALQPASAAHLAQSLAWVSAEVAILWLLLLAFKPWLKRVPAQRRYVVLVVFQFAMGLALPVTLGLLPTPDWPAAGVSQAVIDPAKSQLGSNPVQSTAGDVSPDEVSSSAPKVVSGNHRDSASGLNVSATSAFHRLKINWSRFSPYLCWGYMAVVWLLLGRLIIGCLRGQKLIELSEPIEEIGIRGRDTFFESGGTHFLRIASVEQQPAFLDALAALAS